MDKCGPVLRVCLDDFFVNLIKLFLKNEYDIEA